MGQGIDISSPLMLELIDDALKYYSISEVYEEASKHVNDVIKKVLIDLKHRGLITSRNLKSHRIIETLNNEVYSYQIMYKGKPVTFLFRLSPERKGVEAYFYPILPFRTTKGSIYLTMIHLKEAKIGFLFFVTSHVLDRIGIRLPEMGSRLKQIEYLFTNLASLDLNLIRDGRDAHGFLDNGLLLGNHICTMDHSSSKFHLFLFKTFINNDMLNEKQKSMRKTAIGLCKIIIDMYDSEVVDEQENISTSVSKR